MAKKKQNLNTTNQSKAKKQVENKPVAKPSLPKPKVPADKWLITALAVIAFVVNAATISYDYTLDDPYFTKSNPYVSQGLSATKVFFTHAAYYGVFKNHDASYRPLLLVSFALEKELFGFEPHISHAINLLMFCGLLVALFLLLRRIFNQYSAFIPFFIVLFFALHPIHTEVVASIKSRDEIMAFLFTALCTLQSFKYIDSNKASHLVWSAIYFFLALMSKETPVTFVVIVQMTIYFFRDVPLKKIFMACLPYLVMVVIYMAMRASFIESDGEKVKIMVNNNLLMAAGNESDKLATALFIQLKYILLLIFPHPLSYDYSYNQIPIINFTDVKALASLIVYVSLAVYALFTLKRKNIFSYCILFYLGSTIITSNILVDIGAAMAERFLFTASLGYCIAIVFLLVRLFKADPAQLSYASAPKLFYVVGVIAVLYSVKTVARNADWKNNVVLYESGVETAPNSWRAQYLLGVTYTNQLNTEHNPVIKKDLFNKAIEHLNSSIHALPGTSEAYLLKGYAFEFMGGYDDSAIATYKMVLAIDPANDKASINLGSVYLRQGNFTGAIKILTDVVALDSTNTEAITNLAASYGNKGHFPEALSYYAKALRIKPDQPANVFSSLTNIYHYMGDSAKTQYYRQLLMKKLSEKK